MELTVKQRLVRYLAEKGIGQNKFERLAGISNGYINFDAKKIDRANRKIINHLKSK